MKKSILCLAVSTALTGCFGHDGRDHFHPGHGKGHGNQPEEPELPVDFTPEATTISQLTIVDASGKPIANAEVVITSVNTSTISIAAVTEGDIYYTDDNGNIALSNMEPGIYTLQLTIAGVTVSTQLVIEDDNAAQSATVAAPVSVTNINGEIQASSQQGNGIFASLSGVIYDTNGPISDAQVELDGGDTTNGVITGTLTNDAGEFVLIINLDADKVSALESASLRIIRDGYDTLIIAMDLSSTQGLAGINHELTAETTSLLPVYSESFDAQTESCGSWTAVTESEGDLNLWHQHEAGLGILNQAVQANLVSLAPNDTSSGYVPEPLGSGACWYGQATAGNLGQGNFMGDPVTEVSDATTDGEEVVAEGSQSQSELGGGTSTRPNNGVLVSPWIDLSAETAPLALSFKTWWEIEAVNPNEYGYDIMEVEYSIDDNDWTTIARLNPLTDPADDVDRAALPFSNAGYNRAPYWQEVQPIDISEIAGTSAKFRFTFRTQDELFNGFRGWLIDDVQITRNAGTFPRPKEAPEGELPDDGSTSAYINDLYSSLPVDSLIDFSPETALTVGAIYSGEIDATIKLVRVFPDDNKVSLYENDYSYGDEILMNITLFPDRNGETIELLLQVYPVDSSSPVEEIPLTYTFAPKD